jgi:protease I
MSKRFLLIIAPEQFNDKELEETRSAVESAGHLVHIASTKTGEAQGMHGMFENVDVHLDHCSSHDYDALVIIGGYGSVGYLWESTPLHDLVKAFYAEGKLVSAICVSPAVLAKAGILAGKEVTVWSMPETHDALKAGGAKLSDKSVVMDGSIITANSPDASVAFGQALVDYFVEVAT